MFHNIPVVTKNLLIINVLIFVATWVLELQNVSLTVFGGLHYFMASDFHFYQFLTYQFLHGSFTHLFFNMFALWMFGCVVENVWGPKKFLFYYISCGIGAQTPDITFAELFAVGQQLSHQLNAWSTIGASGAVYAILLAFGMIFPNERIFIFPLPVPIKAKWFVCGYAAIELFMAVNSSGDGVAHMAHLGGMLFGFLMIRYWNRHPDARFNRSSGREFFQRWNAKNARGGSPSDRTRRSGYDEPTYTASTDRDDMAFNARKKQEQEEIDAILDKIRKSGYDSLTKEEKRRLFEASQNR